MRKVILEQTEYKGIQDPTLNLLKSACAESFKNYQPSNMDGKEVLRKDVTGQGYIIIFNDLTYQTYKTDNSKSRSGKVKPCQAYTGTISSPMGKDMQAAIDQLIAKDKSLKKLEDEGVRAGVISGTYVPVDLYSSFGESGKAIFKEPNKYFLYRAKGVGGTLTNVSQDIKNYLSKIGKQLDEPDITSREYQQREPLVTVLKRIGGPSANEMIKRISGELGKQPNEIFVYPLAGGAGGTGENPAGGKDPLEYEKESEQDLATALNAFKSGIDNKMDRKLCKSAIKTLSKAQACSRGNTKTFFGTKNCQSALNSLSTDTVEKMRKYAYQCATQGNTFVKGVFGIQDEINKLLRDGQTPYGLQSFRNSQQNQQTMNESFDKQLKSVVRENLIKLSESKKKSVISEKRYFEIIQLIDEAFDSTYDKKRSISENEAVTNLVKSSLGYGGEGIISYFKERLMDRLIEKFVPGGSKTWLGGIISKTISDVPIGDYFNGEALSCDYWVDAMTKGIAENAVSRLLDKKGLTGGFYDVMRNSLIEVVDDTSFASHIKEGISKMACPILTKLLTVVGSLFGEIKDEITGK